jgi:hypothetical protein
MSPTATESLAFSPPNTTLSGDETKSPTRGSLCCCPDNVTIVETSENLGSDSGIGSAKEGIEAVFSGVRYRRPPLGCLTPSLESVG